MNRPEIVSLASLARQLHTLYYTLHTEHAYCLSYHFLNNVVITTVIEMVEMVEILEGRLGKRSVERVRYVINNLLHLVIVKYGDISFVLRISTRLRLSLLVKNSSYSTLTRVISIRYTLSKCGLCAHITLEFSVIPEAKPRDNRKRESYNERITHTLI